MNEENKEKEKRNAYHRELYAKNIEKERKRNRDKYHKNKKLFSDFEFHATQFLRKCLDNFVRGFLGWNV